MKEFKYVVTDNEGIHARPAGELVKLVKGFESKITIEKDGKTVECRKLLALMGLGVKAMRLPSHSMVQTRMQHTRQ